MIICNLTTFVLIVAFDEWIYSLAYFHIFGVNNVIKITQSTHSI